MSLDVKNGRIDGAPGPPSGEAVDPPVRDRWEKVDAEY
jgi:hypothetical protein